jgi:alpha 1,6-mannosyltransferase
MDLHRAYTVEAEREDQRANWGWKEDRAGPTGSLLLPSKSPNQNKAFPATSAPWESIGQQWVYTRGHWRLGWHPTSVEEWTGPGVWTDSVVS